MTLITLGVPETLAERLAQHREQLPQLQPAVPRFWREGILETAPLPR